MHRLNMAHCDIKPQNIMLKNGKAKLTDFGSVAYCNSEDYNDNGGSTTYFLPPEAKESGYDKQAADVWALGASFFMIA